MGESCHGDAFAVAAPDRVVYDLRRTFARWLDEAGIPRIRRKMYLGHGSSDVTDLYERHELDAYLAADGAKLRAHLESQRAAAAKAGQAGSGGSDATARQDSPQSPTTDNTTAPKNRGRSED